jgi:hypothetical protein
VATGVATGATGAVIADGYAVRPFRRAARTGPERTSGSGQARGGWRVGAALVGKLKSLSRLASPYPDEIATAAVFFASHVADLLIDGGYTFKQPSRETH